ncbi:MAG: peptide chain release factor N(5)-glutamine methyltransferase [Nitrospiria bacterium]
MRGHDFHMLLTGKIDVSDLLEKGTAVLKAHGISSPRLEAESLLCSVLACKRIDMYRNPDKQCTEQQEKLFGEGVKRRSMHEPLQYITGEVGFSGLSLMIRPGVFIPRPETELIVEAVCAITPSPERILDLCTGSGALAVALASRLPFSKITAIDCSDLALSNARLNIARHQCADRVTLLEGDLFKAFHCESGRRETDSDPPRFDLIVCNPPYIPEEEGPHLQPEVRDYEPRAALFAPEKGRAFYRRIVQEAPSYLFPEGLLLFELGTGQAGWLEAKLKKEKRFQAHFVPDMAGIDRVAVCSPFLDGATSKD